MRPMPPSGLGEFVEGQGWAVESFAPASEVTEWSKATFLAEDGQLANEDHAHLRDASIAFL